MNYFEKMVLNIFASATLTLLLFLATSGLVLFLDGTELVGKEADLGMTIMIAYFLTIFFSIQLVVVEAK